MKYFTHHVHTFYCDGKDTPEKFITEAVSKGMSAIGFSAHSPLPFENTYSIKENNLDKYKNEIRLLQKKYEKDINIFLALEFDYIPGMSDNFSFLKSKLGLDYTIGSVHLVKNRNTEQLWFIDGPAVNYTKGLSEIFNDDIKAAVTNYFEQISEMLCSQKPDIVGHLDKIKMHNKGRFFSEEDEWYILLIKKVLDVIMKMGSIIEVNTRGIYKKRCDSLYPGISVLKEIYKMNIPVTLSSDAHKAEELILYFPEAISVLKDIGFKSLKQFDGKLWKDVNIS